MLFTGAIVVLKKDLPGMPKGMIFKQDINGNFYTSLTDAAVMSGKFRRYHFTQKEIIDNPDFFEVTSGSLHG